MPKPSFRKFDYRVRPAKSAERRMLSESFRKLSFFEPIENYRYVGFGSTTFTDFANFHRALNLKKMVSIEKREDYMARFEFNKPFHCIDMKYGASSAVLPKLTWDEKTIVWLDYDGKLTQSVLHDVAFLATKVVSGSVVIVTVNVSTQQPPDEELSDREVLEYRLDQLKKQVGELNVPGDIKGKHLEGDQMALTCRRIIQTQIEENLRDRNGILISDEQIRYQPLYNFTYRDGAKMLTVGGVFFEENDSEIYEKCNFDDLDYVNSDSTPYHIEIPIMTPRERHYLNQRLPEGSAYDAKAIGLTETEIENYLRLYRFSPAYAEVEMS